MLYIYIYINEVMLVKRDVYSVNCMPGECITCLLTLLQCNVHGFLSIDEIELAYNGWSMQYTPLSVRIFYMR